jgi:lipoate-protein ligase A
VAGDVVADGRKLAGGAQRRGKWGLLHQGSIAAKVSVAQLQAGFRQIFHAEFEPYTLPPAELALAEKLTREKYATTSWNHRIAG